jgi:hypothetical protein
MSGAITLRTTQELMSQHSMAQSRPNRWALMIVAMADPTRASIKLLGTSNRQ